jgi:hypothetical protein
MGIYVFLLKGWNSTFYRLNQIVGGDQLSQALSYLYIVEQAIFYWRFNGFFVMPSADGITKKPLNFQ